ncbi:hypothetical protein K435DRAFT_860847 [Dendrothele bispora CBS 962.96]|uniref:DUF6987 domain-containing protein n=1 Tax=Dendrothele bispora (strain CBS 962.96) TaxID=1314807 RepID=A0A4S8LY34_DENBC|nr:hypothetical protein K435DRAFT_860847 [Dendrothele bispora CBS 962.96]
MTRVTCKAFGCCRCCWCLPEPEHLLHCCHLAFVPPPPPPLDSFPKAKRDLGPLLDALGQPLTQIVAGVGMLLAGVLNLVGNLLSGLGLDSLLKGIVSATGLDKIYKGLGLGNWLNSK